MRATAPGARGRNAEKKAKKKSKANKQKEAQGKANVVLSRQVTLGDVTAVGKALQ